MLIKSTKFLSFEEVKVGVLMNALLLKSEKGHDNSVDLFFFQPSVAFFVGRNSAFIEKNSLSDLQINAKKKKTIRIIIHHGWLHQQHSKINH